MPDSIALAAFVIGLVLVIAALLGTRVKIVQVELPELDRSKRVVTGALGAVLVLFGLTDGKLPPLPTAPGHSAAAAAGDSVLSCFADVPKDKPVSYDTLEYRLGGLTIVMDVSYTGDQRLYVRTRQLAGAHALARLNSPT